MRLEIDVVVWRGAIAESRHRVHAVACDVHGAVVAATADRVTTFRSAAKPFQLLPLVERGHASRWGFDDEQLALMAASHVGSPYHVQVVRRILERIGLTADRLACGYHDPADPTSRAHLAAHPEDRSPIYNNCSGKHSGMLALALAEGWPIEGYEAPDHPVQLLMRRTVAEMAGLPPEQLATAVDGCSVPVFGLPLSGMARCYARFAAARPGDSRDDALDRIRRAMCSHPTAVEGSGRLGTALMEATQGRIVAKGGAEGLHCAGVVAAGLGVAVKVEDGEARAVGPATVAILDHLGHLGAAARAALEPWARPQLTNAAGRHVGHIEAMVRAPLVAAE